jgi:hypothetical protein
VIRLCKDLLEFPHPDSTYASGLHFDFVKPRSSCPDTAPMERVVTGKTPEKDAIPLTPPVCLPQATTRSAGRQRRYGSCLDNRSHAWRPRPGRQRRRPAKCLQYAHSCNTSRMALPTRARSLRSNGSCRACGRHHVSPRPLHEQWDRDGPAHG